MLVVAAVAMVGSTGCRDRDRGGFVVVLDAEPRGLDPRFATSHASGQLIGLLHAGLVTVDTPEGEPELELAESIEQRSPTRYAVTLRDGITFHDGHPVTSEDVSYTLTELGSEEVNSPFAALSRRIESFEILDERRFVIELDKPHAPFRTDLSMGIVPAHLCAGRSECAGDPIGAGPFRFVSKEGNKHYVFAPFEGYHGGKPPIDRLVFNVIEDSNTRLLSLLGGNIDLSLNGVAPLMIPVVEDSERLRIERQDSFKYTYIAFNLEHEILDDVRVRRAIAHAIDRDAIIEYKLRGYATPATGMLSPSHWAYEEDVARYPYDPKRAAELLDEAGYVDPDGPEGPKPRFELEFKISSNKMRKSIALLVAQQLSRIGVELVVRSYEWGTFFDDVKSRNFAMTTLTWPSIQEPNMYHWIFHSSRIPTAENRSSGANRGAYRNERVDELLERGQVATDLERRRAIYSEVQQILARDLPYVSLWHEDNIAILKKGVRGFEITPNARLGSLAKTRPPPSERDSAQPR
jgi:peptide/nickel transport system substrate-binding protein